MSAAAKKQAQQRRLERSRALGPVRPVVDPDALDFDAIATAKEHRAQQLAAGLTDLRGRHRAEVAALKQQQRKELAGQRHQQRRARREAAEFRRIARRIGGAEDAASEAPSPSAPKQWEAAPRPKDLIHAHLAERYNVGDTFTALQVAKAMGADLKTTAVVLSGMARSGELRSPKRGLYARKAAKG